MSLVEYSALTQCFFAVLFLSSMPSFPLVFPERDKGKQKEMLEPKPFYDSMNAVF